MGPGTFKPTFVPNTSLGGIRPGTGIFNPVVVDRPFVDPNKGIEQFFDENGPGPTDLDRANWDAATNAKTDIGKAFPNIEKKIQKKRDEESSIKGIISKFFRELFSTIKTSLFIVVIIALGVSFAFFYLKNIAGRVK